MEIKQETRIWSPDAAEMAIIRRQVSRARAEAFRSVFGAVAGWFKGQTKAGADHVSNVMKTPYFN